MTVTWGDVHVGDDLRGSDAAVWTVAGREPGPRWAAAGAFDHFTMRHPDGREHRATKHLIDLAPVVRGADHTDLAHAWQNLTDAGFRLTLMGESIVTDQFGDPAKRGKGSTRDDGIEFDQYGRYLMPHPETGVVQPWTRVTTLTKTLSDTYGLTQWAKRNVAKGMSIRPDLTALAAALDVEEDKSALGKIVEKAEAAAEADRGANFGSAFHKFAERLDRGESLASLKIPSPLDKDLAAYADALKARALRVLPEYMERVVCIPELGACGTLDRIFGQPSGDTHSAALAIGDFKTNKEESLGYAWMEIAVQEACYANATHIWDGAARQWLPMPAVDKARGLVIHSPIGKGVTNVYGVDLIKGWTLAKAAVMVRAWRKDTYSWLVQPESPESLIRQLISMAADSEALAALWTRHQAVWTDELTALGQQRLAFLENR